MDYIILPTTEKPYQVCYLPVSPNGHSFEAKIEMRWFGAAERWFISISDAITGAIYINQIPVVCSYETLNDLLFPFRGLFQGDGIGSLFCIKAVDQPESTEPGRENLQEFHLIWGDRWE